jgi:polysaccharide transporter, PST family
VSSTSKVEEQPRNAWFAENKATSGHGRKSLRGGAISVAARAFNAFLQVGTVVLLARLLTPEDYGLVAMVVALTGFAPVLVDLGTRDAVVQRGNVTEAEVSALFWITVAVGCAMCMVVAVSAPLIARLYGEPRLSSITVVSSLTFLTSAISCQHHALLRRAMEFKKLAGIEIMSNVIGAGTALTMAYFGYGYWALVIRPIVTASLLGAAVWMATAWWPGAPRFSPAVGEMVRFGLNLTGFSLADFFGKTIDRVAIGLTEGPLRLGFYQKAFLVYDNMLDLTISLHGVAVVSLSKVREDPTELKRLWSKGLSTLTFFAMPAFGGLAVIGQDLVVFLLGEKWFGAGAVLTILAIRGIPHVVERTLGWLHVAAGRADRWMRWGILATLVQVIALGCGLPFGTIGVAVAYTVAMFILFVPTIAYAGQPLGIKAFDVIRAVKGPLISSTLSCAFCFFLRFYLLSSVSGTPRMFLLGSIYVAIYFTMAVLLFQVREPLKTVFALISDKRH